MPWIAAGASILGGVLGGQGQSSGGIPKWMKPYVKGSLAQASGVANTPQQYYPGQTTIPETAGETAGWQSRLGYDQGMYGPQGLFGATTGAAGNALTGNTWGGAMTGALAPFGTSAVMGAFGQGPGQVGQYGFNTSLNPQGMAPQFGQAGGLDATQAWQSMLSGTPDYSGAQGAIDAANAPLLRQFNQEIVPGLNQRATFLNNGTGGIKTLNKVLPELGQRMDQNALSVMEGERQRALASQQQAANAVSQGGMQSYGLGLQGAMGQAELQQALAQLRLGTDTTNAGLMSQYRGDTLQLGGLGSDLAGNQDINAARWGSLFPQLAQAGQQPSTDQLNYANFQRQLGEGDIAAQMARFNFGQQEPANRAGWYANIVQGMMGATPQSQTVGGGAQGALGGAILGGQLGGGLASLWNQPSNSVYPGGTIPWVNQPDYGVNIPNAQIPGFEMQR